MSLSLCIQRWRYDVLLTVWFVVLKGKRLQTVRRTVRRKAKTKLKRKMMMAVTKKSSKNGELDLVASRKVL